MTSPNRRETSGRMDAAALSDAGARASKALLDLLLRQENLYTMFAVVSLLTAVRKVIGKASDHHLAVRLAPLYPLLLCSVAVWVPGLQPAEVTPGARVLVGCILGGACGWVHKFWSQTVRGKDSRIKRGDG